MLKTFFTELGARRRSSNNPNANANNPPPADDDGFAATAIMDSEAQGSIESQAASGTKQGPHELLISGSSSQALREYFASDWAKDALGTRLIVIVDPVRVWASLVISTLSRACNQAIERVHLRDKKSLRTLAGIEWTTVTGVTQGHLKIAYADTRPTPGANDIQAALMERSHMSAVIVGPMLADEVDQLLGSLSKASLLASWSCPTLLFLIPPQAAWVQQKIHAQTWPASLQVLCVAQALTSASSAWNAIVAQWRALKRTLSAQSQVPQVLPLEEFDFSQPSLSHSSSVPPSNIVVTPELKGAPGRAKRPGLDELQAQIAWDKTSTMEGMLACALVNDETSQVMARDTRLGHEVNIEATASACAQLMRAHRQSALSMGLSSVDEVTTSSGGRQVMLRPATGRPGFFMMALLDKQRTNMTLARLKLIELDKHLSACD